MERDNLTEALNRWTEKGVDNKDLSAPTLYRDLMAEWLNSDAMMDISTNSTQIIQGKLGSGCLYGVSSFIFYVFNEIWRKPCHNSIFLLFDC